MGISMSAEYHFSGTKSGATVVRFNGFGGGFGGGGLLGT
jgi:hypothetical protein